MRGKIAMGDVGNWTADLEVSSDEPITGAQTLEAFGIEFVGTVKRTPTVIAGRCKVRLIGGAGKLTQEIPARQWANSPTVREIITSALTAIGDKLSATSDSALLAKRVDQWKRNEAPASRAIQAICDNQGALWRVLRDGTVWVGYASYPEVTTEHDLMDEDWSAGVIEIAPDAPELVPGITFRGQQIRYVVHLLEPDSLRSEACLDPPSGLLDRFLAGVRQEIDYSRTYAARVVSQNPDGTLQLSPDDPKQKGTGLNKVPIETGLPGFVVKVLSGARCSYHYENGDPSKPIAQAWKLDPSKVTSIEYKPSGRGAPVACVGDIVEMAIPMNLPLTTSLGPAMVTVTTPVRATIMGPGNAKLLG